MGSPNEPRALRADEEVVVAFRKTFRNADGVVAFRSGESARARVVSTDEGVYVAAIASHRSRVCERVPFGYFTKPSYGRLQAAVEALRARADAPAGRVFESVDPTGGRRDAFDVYASGSIVARILWKPGGFTLLRRSIDPRDGREVFDPAKSAGVYATIGAAIDAALAD